MPRPLLPPRGIFVSTRLLFDQRLSPTLKETLLQLMALAWVNQNSHSTPPLSLTLLEHLTGKDSRTLRGHLAALRNHYAALRLQRADDGLFLVVLAPWLFSSERSDLAGENAPALPDIPAHLLPTGSRVESEPLPGRKPPPPRQVQARGPARAQPGRNLPQADHENDQDDMDDFIDSLTQDESIHLDSQNDQPDHLQTNAEPKRPAQPRRRKANGEGSAPSQGRAASPERAASSERSTSPEGSRSKQRVLSEQLQAELNAAGVYGFLLPEVAASPYSEDELRALLAWSQNDVPTKSPAVFIYRLRIGARVPAEYLRPPCKRCGRRGQHAPECTGRYVMDNYATG